MSTPDILQILNIFRDIWFIQNKWIPLNILEFRYSYD